MLRRIAFLIRVRYQSKREGEEKDGTRMSEDIEHNEQRTSWYSSNSGQEDEMMVYWYGRTGVCTRTYLFRREVFQGHGGSSVHVLVLVLGRAVDHLIDINDDDGKNGENGGDRNQ